MSQSGGPVRWIHRLRLDRPSPSESVEWEIEHHLEELTDRLVASGMDRESARRAAERRFGDLRRYGPEMRRMERRREAMKTGTRCWETLREGGFAVARGLRRAPGFTVAVVATLALGIGANATMYGIIDRLLLSPPDHILAPERVMRVAVERTSSLTGARTTQATMTVPDVRDLDAHGGLVGVALYSYREEMTVGSGPDAGRVWTVRASHDLFPVLGVAPIAGRLYGPGDDQLGADPTALISQEMWERAFGADPAAVGRRIELSGTSVQVVGVLPAGFTGADLAPVDVWLPLTPFAFEGCLTGRGCYWVRAVARLAEGVSVDAAGAEATALHLGGRADSVEEGDYPADATIVLSDLVAAGSAGTTAEARVAGWLAGVSIIVLLIACANVANLLLARSTRRRREVAVRLALGVSRRRLILQMVTESVLLALGGGLAALVLAAWGGDLVRGALLPGVYFPSAVVSGGVLGFTAVAALAAGLMAGVGPAVQATRGELTGSLGDVRGGSARRSRGRSLLTVAQAAMSVVLLVGAGLFVRSLAELRSLDLGLDVDRLLQAQLELADDVAALDVAGEAAGGLDTRAVVELHERAAERLRALPEVEEVAITSVPFQSAYAMGLDVQGLDSVPRLPGGGPYYFAVSPTYFETMGLSALAGRGIERDDIEGAEPVAVVSQTMSRMLWPDGGALGACLLLGRDQGACTTVVGVVEDAARDSFRDEPFMAYYLAMAQRDQPARGLYVRTTGRPDAAVGAVASVLRSLGPEVRYATVESMREVLEPQARSWRLGATMFSVFGLLALVVAAVGLYSVLAFDVAQRTRELGIRTALGAQKGVLLGGVVRDGIWLAGAGVAMGLLAAWGAGPYAAELLFEVSPRDPLVLAGVAILLMLVALAASLVPGLRATHVNPMIALRSE